LERLGVGDGD